MNAHPSNLRAAALLIALGSALACSAILKPRDEVQRCGSADDCDPIDDKRYTPICKYDEEHANTNLSKFDKICVADYKRNVGCDPMQYTVPDNPFMKAIDACGDLGCAMENDGQLGCPPLMGACLGGAPLSMFGEVPYCGPPDVIPGFALSDDLENQHVKDAFCQSFFCDDTFVCSNTTHKCVPCNDDDAYGQGGCGTVYNDGAPAPVYLGPELMNACPGKDADVNEPVFGGGCGD